MTNSEQSIRPAVYITRQIPESGIKLLKQDFEVVIWPDFAPPSKQEIISQLKALATAGSNGAKRPLALISLLSDKIDRELLTAATPNLKIVAQYAVGTDNIDLEAASELGIFVTNTPDVLTETSADFSWALLLAAARRVIEADRYVRAGNWQVAWHPSMITGVDVYGAHLGIIGAGRIGSAVARRAQGFNMEISYYNRSPRPRLENETGAIRAASLEELLKTADFISINLPLTPQTRGLINAERLALVKPSAVLVSNARGPVIDEQALYQALASGRLAAAGLDVFETEPLPVNSPLLKLDNIVLAPHISSDSHRTRTKMAELAANNILALHAGRTPVNLVNSPNQPQLQPQPLPPRL